MKLEVGIYVRTKKGIAKIIDRILEPNHYYFKMWVTDKFLEINDDTEYISEVDVLKASHNIIDLIEVGDYINGFYVEDVKETFVNVATGSNYFQSPSINEEDIKSIVTKEQFESIKYNLDGVYD